MVLVGAGGSVLDERVLEGIGRVMWERGVRLG